jgi:hypothetical protein
MGVDYWETGVIKILVTPVISGFYMPALKTLPHILLAEYPLNHWLQHPLTYVAFDQSFFLIPHMP